jgi:hypothetical protein
MNRLALFSGLATLLVAAPQARALVVLESGKSQLFVTATGELTWDSNVYSNASQASDFYETGRIALDYDRKAGIFSASAGAELAYSHFQRLQTESGFEPSFRASLARVRGRLTGRANVEWREANESDNAANQRTRFREWNGHFELQYPLNHRFSVKATTAYESRDYLDPTLFDRKILSEAVDVFHAYTSKLDLVAGYRVRWSDLPESYNRVDHALMLGANGKILPRLDGSVRIGYQRRIDQTPGARNLDALTASIATWWAPRNWVTFGLQVTKDFSTTATALSADGFNGGLDAKLTTVSQIAVTAGLGYAHYTFYDKTGLARTDDSVYGRLGVEYPLTKRLKLTATATWLRNSSTFAFADYDRRLLNFGVSARY